MLVNLLVEFVKLRARVRVLELELLDRKVQELDKPKLTVNIQEVESQSLVDLMKRNPRAIIEPLVEQMQLGNKNLISAEEAARSASRPLVDPQ